ncbi:MAG: METTL5 family protein [Promethearchaeota archaeon]
MKKHELVGMLDTMKGFDPEKAKVKLEQYATDSRAAVEMLFIAGFMHDDIAGHHVIDLGAGTGRLAISSLHFGAVDAIAVEVDRDAIAVARENANEFGVAGRVHIINSDVHHLPFRPATGTSPLDAGCTIVMNPPFGVKRKGADVRFLESAMNSAPRCCKVIYSFHLKNEGNRTFLKRKVEKRGWQVDALFQVRMTLPRLYTYHKRDKKQIDADIYRITRATNS